MVLEDLLTRLVSSRVVLVYRGDPSRGESYQWLAHRDGSLLLGVFTTAKRARLARNSGFRQCVEVDFGAVADLVRQGAGFILNPGWEDNMKMSPDGVRQMITEFHL